MADRNVKFVMKGAPAARYTADQLAAFSLQLGMYGNAYPPPRPVLVKPCAFPYAHTLHDWHTLPGRAGKMFRCTGTRTAPPARGRHFAPEPRWARTFSIIAVAVVLAVAGVVTALLRAW